MIVITILFYGLGIIALIGCYVIVILGILWIVNYELKELCGTDFVRKWMEKKK